MIVRLHVLASATADVTGMSEGVQSQPPPSIDGVRIKITTNNNNINNRNNDSEEGEQPPQNRKSSKEL